jgi:hypothetical protein
MAMKCCPICGADLQKAAEGRRQRKWNVSLRDRKRYNDYQREYHRKYRARKRAATGE